MNVPFPAALTACAQMRYAAFLRAVNLGKNRRVTNDRLKELFEEAGAEEVATFRTSGNVVFEARATWRATLEKHLEKALGHEMVDFPAAGRS